MTQSEPGFAEVANDLLKFFKSETWIRWNITPFLNGSEYSRSSDLVSKTLGHK
jgi:hypothetical protein